MSNKSLEEKIIDIIIKSVYQYYYLDCCNDEKATTQTQTIFDQTGFVSLDIENSKAFIYALHPSKFIKDNDLRRAVALEKCKSKTEDEALSNLKKEYNIILCIGLFEIGKPQGIQVSKRFEDISLDLKKD